MSNRKAIVDQLTVIFPSISEDFLAGICDVYSEENIEELIEVVLNLTFEFPPLRANLDEVVTIEQNSDNARTPEQTFIESQSGLDQEKISSAPLINTEIRSDDILVGLSTNEVNPSPLSVSNSTIEINEDASADVKVNNQPESSENICDGKPTQSNLAIENGQKVPIVLGEISQDSAGSCLLGVDQTKSLESEDDTLPIEESSTHYFHLFWESVDSCSKKNKSTPSPDSTKITKGNDECKGESSLENISSDNKNLENCNDNSSKKSNPSTSSSCRRRKPLPRKQAFHPEFPKKLPSFCCSKIKNDEHRLRMRLIRQSRLLHKFKPEEEPSLNGSQFHDNDSKFSFLSKVLTDADPEFLITKSQEFTSHEQILMFISDSLENRDYPKLKKSEPKVPIAMDSFQCNIDDFLVAVPDPNAEFSSDYYLRNGYENNAEIYLQSRYQYMSPARINEMLLKYKYNLVRVCSLLDAEGQVVSPYSLDSIVLDHPASVFFHQEVFYIENRTKIQDFLDSAVEAAKVEEELNRPPTPPPVEEIFECGICCFEVEDYSDLGTCDAPKGHLFCNECIRKNADVKLGESATKFPCLAENCKGLIPLHIIKKVLPDNTWAILEDKIMEADVMAANITGIEYCPFCPYAYGPGEDQQFLCLNPKCMKPSCRICRKEVHQGMCDIFKEEDTETARHLIENTMTEAMKRACYKCKIPFVKETGCNKMTCPKCNVSMCYICRQPVTDYSHFNGQGGDNLDRCELFSTEEAIHTNPVQVVAQQTLNTIRANNPHMNLDANIIPK